MKRFEVGDLVALKCGTFAMVVTSNRLDNGIIKVGWLDEACHFQEIELWAACFEPFDEDIHIKVTGEE